MEFAAAPRRDSSRHRGRAIRASSEGRTSPRQALRRRPCDHRSVVGAELERDFDRLEIFLPRGFGDRPPQLGVRRRPSRRRHVTDATAVESLRPSRREAKSVSDALGDGALKRGGEVRPRRARKRSRRRGPSAKGGLESRKREVAVRRARHRTRQRQRRRIASSRQALKTRSSRKRKSEHPRRLVKRLAEGVVAGSPRDDAPNRRPQPPESRCDPRKSKAKDTETPHPTIRGDSACASR